MERGQESPRGKSVQFEEKVRPAAAGTDSDRAQAREKDPSGPSAIRGVTASPALLSPENLRGQRAEIHHRTVPENILKSSKFKALVACFPELLDLPECQNVTFPKEEEVDAKALLEVERELAGAFEEEGDMEFEELEEGDEDMPDEDLSSQDL